MFTSSRLLFTTALQSDITIIHTHQRRKLRQQSHQWLWSQSRSPGSSAMCLVAELCITSLISLHNPDKQFQLSLLHFTDGSLEAQRS